MRPGRRKLGELKGGKEGKKGKREEGMGEPQKEEEKETRGREREGGSLLGVANSESSTMYLSKR